MEREPDYSQMTTDEEDDLLRDIIQDEGIASVLGIGDVYTILKEHHNNEILDRWVKANPEKAFPKPDNSIEYVLPEYWASYLINGDASGLEDGEQEEIDAFLEREGNPSFVDCSEESYFSHSNDATNLGGDVLEYTAIIEPKTP